MLQCSRDKTTRGARIKTNKTNSTNNHIKRNTQNIVLKRYIYCFVRLLCPALFTSPSSICFVLATLPISSRSPEQIIVTTCDLVSWDRSVRQHMFSNWLVGNAMMLLVSSARILPYGYVIVFPQNKTIAGEPFFRIPLACGEPYCFDATQIVFPCYPNVTHMLPQCDPHVIPWDFRFPGMSSPCSHVTLMLSICYSNVAPMLPS